MIAGSTVEDVDVMIAGAGPVGLAPATELGHRGVRCMVIERNDRVGYSPRADTRASQALGHRRHAAPGLAHLPRLPPDVVFATRMNGPALARFHNAFNGRRERNELYS